MLVYIRDPEEWSRILEARKPSPLYVSTDSQWFRDGRGTTFIFMEIPNANLD